MDASSPLFQAAWKKRLVARENGDILIIKTIEGKELWRSEGGSRTKRIKAAFRWLNKGEKAQPSP